MALADELRRRQNRNPRYSLRAFARALDTHHTTLARILRGRRRVTPRTIRRLGSRLRLTAPQVADACQAESCAAILRLLPEPGFRPDMRWIAVTAGIPLDAAAIALHRLLHDRRLVMASPTRWIPGER